MDASHILVVHNDPAVRQVVADALRQESFRVSGADSDEEGLTLLERQRVHVLVTALDMFGRGDEFVRRAATIQPLLGVVLIDDANRPVSAAHPVRPGPVQYLPKPITRDSLCAAVQRVMDGRTRRGPAKAPENTAALQGAAAAGENGRIIAVSKAMRDLLALLQRCAPTEAPLLIYGEPDTGKELIARESHRRSRRASGPFVHVACGALREAELAEKLLGQHENKTDRSATPSLLEKACGGTLFLENVAELPLWSQVRLLAVLQQGGSGGVAADVRVIASSTGNLQTAVARRAFSSSLYYYLNVVEVHVPSLRHRPQDIRPLAEMYLAIANAARARQGGKGCCRFSEEAVRCLVEYEWPGNALQLASVVAHATLLADTEEIAAGAIAESLGERAPCGDSDAISLPLVGGLKEMERAIIEAVIERCQGNKAAAARLLRLHRRTLYRMLHDEPSSKKSAAFVPLILTSPEIAAPADALCRD